MRVSQDNANLRGRGALPGELADLVDDLVGGGLQPSRGGARVGQRRGRDTLSVAVKSAHLVGCAVVVLMVLVVLSEDVEV